MGSMSAGNGIPPMQDFPKIYWGVVGGTIGIATVVNIINILICRQRYGWNGLATEKSSILTTQSGYQQPVKVC